MRCCHTALSLELMGLMIHLLVKMDRPELADKHLRMMQAADDDATLTQLATAWVDPASGGSKIQDAFFAFQELGDKYAWTSKLYNGSAVCQMAMGRYEEAEKDLVEAINRDSKDPEALQKLGGVRAAPGEAHHAIREPAEDAHSEARRDYHAGGP